MSETDKVFAGSIPEFYDTFLVPLIFQGFAADLALRVSSSNPASVLETAAGSGVVTRALAPRLDRWVQDGVFRGGIYEFGLADGGVGYIYDDANRALIPDALRARLAVLQDSIVAGQISVPTARR